MAEEKKMGRPTDNPKGRPIHVRLDAEADAILEAYCARENVTRAEAIRRGIYLLNHRETRKERRRVRSPPFSFRVAFVLHVYLTTVLFRTARALFSPL